MPDFPWDLLITTEDGAALGRITVDGGLPRALLIRPFGVQLQAMTAPYGPAPNTTCEPADQSS